MSSKTKIALRPVVGTGTQVDQADNFPVCLTAALCYSCLNGERIPLFEYEPFVNMFYCTSKTKVTTVLRPDSQEKRL